MGEEPGLEWWPDTQPSGLLLRDGAVFTVTQEWVSRWQRPKLSYLGVGEVM